MSRYTAYYTFDATPTRDPRDPMGGSLRNYGRTGLNQVNGLALSLAPGLYEYQQQFAKLGFTDFRAHDLFGVGDIDAYYDLDAPGFVDQITNNAPDDRKSGIKTFVQDFVDRRTLVTNIADVYNNNAAPAYNWAPTDSYFQRALANPYDTSGKTPNILFRVGRLIDGGRVEPSNLAQYLAIVEAVVNRYTVNYQQTGLARPVLEYEIWNEPDLGIFWYSPGSDQSADAVAQRYYDFYKQVSTAIKGVAPNAKVGAPGVAGANGSAAFVDNFLAYVAQNSVPLDFYSLHNYPSDTPDYNGITGPVQYVSDALAKNNLSSAEIYVTEWNSTQYASTDNNVKVQSVFNAAFIVEFVLASEQVGLDKAYYYRGDSAEFGLFDNATDYTPAGQAFYLYNQLIANRDYTLSMTGARDDVGAADEGFHLITINALASMNKGQDKILVLASQYKPDSSLTDYNAGNTLPPGVTLTAEHYIDDSKPASDLTGSNEYYGNTGTGSNTYYYGTATPPKPNANQFYRTPEPTGINTANRPVKPAETQQTSKLSVTIQNINDQFTSYRVTVNRIVPGGQLDTPEGTRETLVSKGSVDNDGSLSFTDDHSRYGDYSAHLYTVQLD